jgi:hypothetical protein
MARLPHSDRAVLDLRKIEDYCLNPLHPRGRHKARVFRDALEIDRNDAQWLRERLLAGVNTSDATELPGDSLGRRWRVDIPVTRQRREIVVRTIWFVRTGETVPRLVSCWVL